MMSTTAPRWPWQTRASTPEIWKELASIVILQGLAWHDGAGVHGGHQQRLDDTVTAPRRQGERRRGRARNAGVCQGTTRHGRTWPARGGGVVIGECRMARARRWRLQTKTGGVVVFAVVQQVVDFVDATTLGRSSGRRATTSLESPSSSNLAEGDGAAEKSLGLG
jgi:hypothetical protein